MPLSASGLIHFRFNGFGEVGELVGTQQSFLTFGNRFVPFGIRGVDAFLYLTAFRLLSESTGGINFQKDAPRLFRYLIGQHFHVVGAGCRVQNLIKMAFFLEQQLLVPCQTATKIVRCAVRRIEGGDRNCIHTRQSGTHCFRLAPQQIYVTIVTRLVPR